MFGVIAAAGLCAFAAVAVMFLGWASPTLGWLFSAAALLPCLVVGSLIAVGPRRVAGYVVSLVVALALGGALWWTAPPDHGRISGMVDDQDLAGFTVVAEEAWGNTWCFKGCPTLEVSYRADDPALGPDDAAAQLVETLEAQGWREDYRNEWTVRLTKGRWRASVGPSAAAEYGYGDPETDVDVEWGAS